MSKLDVVDANNKGVGSVELPDELFAPRVSESVVHLVVRQQLAARRAGTHATKNRAKITGGGAKPWRQKGTGRARSGSRRSPIWRGGATIFGPQPRDYTFKVNKKVRRLALGAAIGDHAKEGTLKVVKEFSVGEFKTKKAVAMLEALGAERPLVVLDKPDEMTERSLANLPRTGVVRVEGLNVYDVLLHDTVVITEAALAALIDRLSGKTAAAPESESAA